MTASIFTKNISTGFDYTPRELISEEITHLKGMGQSRWRTNPFMATCRTMAGFVFLTLLVLYFMDPFRFAVQKTKAINAYLYLVRFGNPTQVEPLRTSGMFTNLDWQQLAHRGQLAQSEEVKSYFISTSEAQQYVEETVAFMNDLMALKNGSIADATPLTKIRYYLFRQFGIIPPLEWLSLNPVIEAS